MDRTESWSQSARGILDYEAESVAALIHKSCARD